MKSKNTRLDGYSTPPINTEHQDRVLDMLDKVYEYGLSKGLDIYQIAKELKKDIPTKLEFKEDPQRYNIWLEEELKILFKYLQEGR